MSNPTISYESILRGIMSPILAELLDVTGVKAAAYRLGRLDEKMISVIGKGEPGQIYMLVFEVDSDNKPLDGSEVFLGGVSGNDEADLAELFAFVLVRIAQNLLKNSKPPSAAESISDYGSVIN